MKRLILILVVQVVFATSAIAGGNAAAGKEKSQACVACHGEAGMSAVSTFPNLAGQYQDYLYFALQSYKSGIRNNAIMSGIVAALSKQDMKDLAAYYSSLNGLESFVLPAK